MIDKKKLSLMINLARFENRQEDHAFRITKSTQSDYTAYALIRNFLLTPVAYLLLLVLIAMLSLDTMVTAFSSSHLRPLIAAVIVGYLIVLGVYSVLVYIIARLRYMRAQNAIRQYNRGLDRLRRIYREEDEGLDMENEEEN